MGLPGSGRIRVTIHPARCRNHACAGTRRSTAGYWSSPPGFCRTAACQGDGEQAAGVIVAVGRWRPQSFCWRYQSSGAYSSFMLGVDHCSRPVGHDPILLPHRDSTVMNDGGSWSRSQLARSGLRTFWRLIEVRREAPTRRNRTPGADGDVVVTSPEGGPPSPAAPSSKLQFQWLHGADRAKPGGRDNAEDLRRSPDRMERPKGPLPGSNWSMSD